MIRMRWRKGNRRRKDKMIRKSRKKGNKRRKDK